MPDSIFLTIPLSEHSAANNCVFWISNRTFPFSKSASKVYSLEINQPLWTHASSESAKVWWAGLEWHRTPLPELMIVCEVQIYLQLWVPASSESISSISSWGLFLNSKCLANSTTLNRLWQWVLFDFFLIYHLEIACELWVLDQVCPGCLPVRSLKEMEVQFNSKTWIGSFNFNFHFSDQIYVESLTWTIQIEVENQHQFHFLVSVA